MRAAGAISGAALLSALVLVACAARADDSNICFGVSEESDSAIIRVARVIGSGRAGFVESATTAADKATCPSANAACKTSSYVLPGDLLLVEDAPGDYACATFQTPKGGGHGGWLPKARLEMKTPPQPKLIDWAGKWKRAEAEIELKVKGDKIESDGEATWGAGDARRVKMGGVHVGNFDGSSAPRGATLAVGDGYDGAQSPPAGGDDTGCKVRMRLFSPFMLVEDNQNCGGANVSFSGIYLRATK